MRLTEREIDKLLIFTAADVARRRKMRGLKLNHPEAIALISAEVLEGIRDGRSVAELMAFGATVLGRDDVMEGVPEMIKEIQTHVKTRLAAHEAPREIEFLDEFPSTVTGKIMRRELRAREQSKPKS